MAEIINKAWSMLERYPLCDHCLGRQFALLGYGMDDDERGRTIKTALTMEGHRLTLQGDGRGLTMLRVLAANGSFKMAADILRRMGRQVEDGRRCFLCEGRFESLPKLVDKIMKKLDGYEYESFLVGVKLPVEVEEREDEFKAEFGVEYSEGMRNDFSRTIGKAISENTGKTVDYRKPELTVIVNPFTGRVRIQVNPLYIMGRYRKMVRGIPQSKWICTKCRGKGCPRCNWTGKMYPESVEELIAGPVLRFTQGEDTSFHSAGREDVDARMLGEGRPFIIEVKKPRRRRIDLTALKEAINGEAEGKIEVSDLHLVGKDMVRKLKRMEGAEKIYRVVVEFERAISDDEIERIKRTFTNMKIAQRTPLRVLHRRADKVREKYIYETDVRRLMRNRVEMRIRCQGGLYVKELVTGDEGRTSPSVSEVVNAKATPLELDVLDIIME